MQQYKLPTLKILTNIPEFITFNFPDFKTGVGEYGDWFKYEVTHKGEAKSWFPTPFLHNKLQSLGNLEGQTIQVLKYETNGKTLWKLMDERGTEIALNAPQSTARPSTPKSDTSAIEMRIAKIERILNDNGIFEIPVI
jgi:hypothetical protein